MTSKRIIMTIPLPLPLGIECGVVYHDDEPDSVQDVFIAFNQPIPGDDDYFEVLDLGTVADLYKAIDANLDVFDPDNGSWYIDLTQPIKECFG